MLACAFRLCLRQAVFKVVGSNKRFPIVKDSYVTDENDMAKRSVLDGDSFLPGASASWRFRSPEVEPYMSSQGKGLPWFSVNKVRAADSAGWSRSWNRTKPSHVDRWRALRGQRQGVCGIHSVLTRDGASAFSGVSMKAARSSALCDL
jgi:hypothetical protein